MPDCSQPPPALDRHYRQIVQSVTDAAIIGTDCEGRVVSWNEGARLILGWSAQDMLGQTLHRIFTAEDRAAGAVEREMEQAQRTGKASGERWHHRSDGERFRASGQLMPLRSDPGAVTGFVKILRDRTGQQQNEERLRLLNETLQASEQRLQLALDEALARQAAAATENAMLLRAVQDSDRAKDVFLATLAHELRNPLAPVWNGLTIIARDPHDAQRVMQVAGMIERQVGQLVRLVDDLLDVSRITTGKIELKKEAVDLGLVLRSAIETSRPHIEAARQGLSLVLPDEPVEVDGDPVRLAQVFGNLLNNASKYTQPGGQIDVIVGAEPHEAVVRVRDTGEGLAPDMLTRVFGLFSQVSHPAQRHHGGLGIGLSLVEGLVRLHGGTVEARSPGLGAGSEFIVRLPRRVLAPSGAADDDTRPAPLQPRAAARPRILVVDDNVDGAATLAELLRMMGCDVSVANDGTSAVSAVNEYRPQVVLLDIGLPDINGYEVARRVRALPGLRQPRLIALTGWGQEQDKRMAAEAGFDEHWTKPVDPSRLQQLAGA